MKEGKNPVSKIVWTIIVVTMISLACKIKYDIDTNKFTGVVKVVNKFMHERGSRPVIYDTDGHAWYVGRAVTTELEGIELNMKLHVGKCYNIKASFKSIYFVKEVECQKCVDKNSTDLEE
jgi:hypothetical protein